MPFGIRKPKFDLPDPFGLSTPTKFAPSDILNKKKLKSFIDTVTPDRDFYQVEKLGLDPIRDALKLPAVGGRDVLRRSGKRSRALGLNRAAEELGQGLQGAWNAQSRAGQSVLNYAGMGTEEESQRQLQRRGLEGQNPLLHTLGSAISGEQYLNDITGTAQLGSRGRRQLERVPGIGGTLGTAADIALSPSTIATVGAGGALGSTLRGVPRVGRPLAGLAEPIAGPGAGLTSRFLGETAAGLGAMKGAELLGQTGIPGAGLIGGLVGGGIGAGGFNAASRRLRPPIRPSDALPVTHTSKEGEIVSHETPREIQDMLRGSRGGDIGQGLYTTADPYPTGMMDKGDTVYGAGLKPGEVGQPKRINLKHTQDTNRLEVYKKLTAGELRQFRQNMPTSVRNEYDLRYESRYGPGSIVRDIAKPEDTELKETGLGFVKDLDSVITKITGEAPPKAYEEGGIRFHDATLNVLRRSNRQGLYRNSSEQTTFPADIETHLTGVDDPSIARPRTFEEIKAEAARPEGYGVVSDENLRSGIKQKYEYSTETPEVSTSKQIFAKDDPSIPDQLKGSAWEDEAFKYDPEAPKGQQWAIVDAGTGELHQQLYDVSVPPKTQLSVAQSKWPQAQTWQEAEAVGLYKSDPELGNLGNALKWALGQDQDFAKIKTPKVTKTGEFFSPAALKEQTAFKAWLENQSPDDLEYITQSNAYASWEKKLANEILAKKAPEKFVIPEQSLASGAYSANDPALPSNLKSDLKFFGDKGASYDEATGKWTIHKASGNTHVSSINYGPPVKPKSTENFKGFVNKALDLFGPESQTPSVVPRDRKPQFTDEQIRAQREAESAFNQEIVEPEKAAYEAKIRGDEITPELQADADKYKDLINKRISGGAPQPLVTEQAPRGGLSLSEKTSDLFERTMRMVTGKGVPEHKVATPIVREAQRRHRAIGSQSRHFANIATRAENMLDIDKNTGLSAKYSNAAGKPYTLEQLARLKKARALVTTEESKVLDQLLAKEAEFADHVRILGRGRKAIHVSRRKGTWLTSKAVEQYGEKVGNETLKRYLEDASKQITSMAGMANAKDLPESYTKVIQKAIDNAYKGAEPNRAIRATQTINRAAKLVWASADMSIWGIQALLSGYDSPKQISKIVATGFKSLVDEDAFAKFAAKYDERAILEGRPTVSEWLANDLHFSGTSSAQTDIERATGGLLGKVGEAPIIKQSNRAFGTSGDLVRLAMADLMYQQTKMRAPIPGLKLKAGASREDTLRAISNSVNRSSGYSHTPFAGDIGEIALFAPRFLQSQLETLAALPKQDLQGQVARRQLVKTIALGTAITVLANEARDKTTDFNPFTKDGKVNSNFMKIRDLGGVDVSVFGTWDSLARVIANTAMGVPGVPGEGDLTYGLDTKAGPLLSIIQDIARGESFSGIPTDSPEYWLRLPLPFSIRDTELDTPWGQIGSEGEPPVGVGFGGLGLKTTPLSRQELLDKELEKAGISKSNPDYEILRRDFLAEHPEILERDPRKGSEEFVRISQSIREKEALNDSRTQSGDQTLVEFRDNRKLLNKEKRDKLEIAVGEFDRKPRNKQQEWIQSYYDLFSRANPDPITGAPDPDILDQLTFEWTEENGPEAKRFIDRYTLSGQTTVEKAYLQDLQTLQNAGYFEVPRYQGLTSGLDDDEIAEYRDRVSSARSADPDLADMDYSDAAEEVLSNIGLTAAEVQDIINAGSQDYENPEFTALKDRYHKELSWFNPDMKWADYQKATAREAEFEPFTTRRSGGRTRHSGRGRRKRASSRA